MGRPSTFTQETADAICARLAEGESLRAICRGDGMPDPSTVLRWADDKENEAFAQQYARARAVGYQLLGDEIVQIADEAEYESVPGQDGESREVRFDATAVARNRLRVDTRKWMLSKMLPKVYGDKLDLNHAGSIRFDKIETVIVDPAG